MTHLNFHRVDLMFGSKHVYSLRKSRHILKTACQFYQKQRQKLTPPQLLQFESDLKELDEAILKRDKEESSRLSHSVEEFCNAHFKKGVAAYAIEMTFAIVIALAVATLVRQTWFELYEIPTGSMRPTFKEQDHLTVTKTAFGINVPLATKHFYFNPQLVQRLSVAIWSGDGIPHLDSDSTFMGIFPYTKRYIKRCMGKPGDTLYFYGGKIYGFDRDGNDLSELRDNPWTSLIESIPFTNFEGRQSFLDDRGSNSIPEAVFHHFNQGIGRLLFQNQEIKGQIYNGTEWVKDNPLAQRQTHNTIQTYSDFWGIRNFALARLLNKDQLESLTSYRAKDLEDALLYLELRHTPSLSYPAPLLSNRFGAAIQGYTTVIPLQERHLKALMKNLYTCRFVVKNGRASPYRQGSEKTHPTNPPFPNVPNGTYEFYYGKAYNVGWGGITYELPQDSPLYNSDPKNIQKLFNIGIEMNTSIEPTVRNQPFFPNRYVYFRNGALFTMGGMLMEKEDSLLKSFHSREEKKKKRPLPNPLMSLLKTSALPLMQKVASTNPLSKYSDIKCPMINI